MQLTFTSITDKMYKLLNTLILTVCMHISFAQTIPVNVKYPFSQLTMEPAIGTRLNSLMGSPDIQVANLLQYNYKKRLSFIAHTAISSDLKPGWVTDVRQNYSYSFFQKFGIGTSFYTKRSSNTFSILAGVAYNAYSGTMNNDQFAESITTKASSLRTDYGIMYNLKSGRKKYFLSSRLYLPLKDGLYGISENADLEFGIGMRLK